MLMGGRHFEGGLMAFLNPPHAALAGVPFGWLADYAGERAAFLAWTAVSAALLVLLDRWVREAWGARAGPARWLITSALVAFYPVFHTFNIGQTSLVLAVAVMGVYRWSEAERPAGAAAWLTALTIKPQLTPAIVVFLAMRRRWRVLEYAAAMIATAAAIAALALGPATWVDYVRHVGGLEDFFGSGTPAHMLNIRGALTRIAGAGDQPMVDRVSFVVWIGGAAAVAVYMWRRRVDRIADARAAYAFAVATALLASPHLFVQDVVVWVVPLVLHAASVRDAGRNWRPFAAFALSWPALFAVARSVDLAGGAPRLAIDPAVVALVIATAVMSS